MGTKIDLNWEKLDGMLMFDATERTCVDELECSRETIERNIKKKYDMTFAEYKQTRLERTVLRLKQRIIKKALDGDNACLIFSLKNLAKWSDNKVVQLSSDEPLRDDSLKNLSKEKLLQIKAIIDG